MVFNIGQTTLGAQSFGISELRIRVDRIERGLTPKLVPGCEVDQERTVIERRRWIREGKIAYCFDGSIFSAMQQRSLGWVTNGKSNAFVGTSHGGYPRV